MAEARQSQPAGDPARAIRIHEPRRGPRSLSGRSYASLDLAPGELVSDGMARAGWRSVGGVLIVVVLDGTLESALGLIEPGMAGGFSPSAPLRAGAGGCVAGVIEREQEEPCPAEWTLRPELAWYDKYAARVGPLRAGEEEPLLPWSGYLVEIPGNSSDVLLHIHEHLTNLIFIVGDRTSPQGVVVVRTGGATAAQSLHGGDMALVHAGIEHNVIPASGDRSLRFFVLNDKSSRYEDEHGSDYHLLEPVPRPRPAERPSTRGLPVLVEVGAV